MLELQNHPSPIYSEHLFSVVVVAVVAVGVDAVGVVVATTNYSS